MTETDRVARIRRATAQILDLRVKGHESLAELLYRRELRLVGVNRTHDVNAALCLMELAASVPADKLPRERRRIRN